MANLAIYKDDYIEFTAISNYFIDNYMKDANDAQLKVYLYLVRMVHANMAFGVSDIADKLCLGQVDPVDVQPKLIGQHLGRHGLAGSGLALDQQRFL